MSKNRYTDILCVAITVLALVLTILFMNGKALGMSEITSDDTADRNGIFSERDLDESWNEETATQISLDRLEHFRSGGAYELNGDLYIINKGSYVLSGELKDQQIIVSAKGEKVQLVLSGINIEETDKPAIDVQKADKVFITLEDGTENTVKVGSLLSDIGETEGEASENEDSESLPDAAIYSVADLTINGTGSLSVSTEAGHGIKSKDDLVIINGNISIDAEGTALLGKDSVRIGGGTFDLKAGNDGIKANNETNEEKGYVKIVDGVLTIESEHDGIQAQTNLEIEGGEITITTGGGSLNAEQKTEEFGHGGFQKNLGGMDGSGKEGFSQDSGEMGEFAQKPGRGRMFENGEMPEDFTPPEGMERGRKHEMMPDAENGFGQQMEPPDGLPQENEHPEQYPQPGTKEEDTFSEQTGQQEQPDNKEEQYPSAQPELMENNMQEIDSTNTSNDSCKGLKAGNLILITGGVINLDTKEDAIHSDQNLTIENGTFSIKAGDDALHADHVLTVTDGTIVIESCYEGVEAKTIEIAGGNIDLTSSDDGFNASDGSTSMGGGFRGNFASARTNTADEQNTSAAETKELPLLHITGGEIHVDARGDGLDSNGDQMIEGGTIIIDGPSDSGNGALDSGTESGGDLTIHGGTILALGASGMAETFSDNSTQYSFLCTFDVAFEQGDTITISDSSGKIIYSYIAQKNGNSIVFSSPDLVQGETYTITAGVVEQQMTVESITNGKSPGRGMGRSW